MPQLLFRREFFPAIRAGQKTTTIRRWKSGRVAPNDLTHTRGLGTLRVLACARVEIDDLTDADARADGFESLAELRAVLRKLYPNARGDGRHWYRVEFRLEHPEGLFSPAAAPTRKPSADAPMNGRNKRRLARQIRAELDNVVRRSRSLFPL